jgi:hypothetical protein
MRRVAAIAVGAVTLLAGSPAQAQAALKPYDHQDPYRSGCGNSARVVKTAAIKSRIHGEVGTIKLMWSGRCQTNWTEVKTASSARGTINVYTADGRHNRFSFKAGNGGRHWGDMLSAKDMCAWGSVSIQWNGGNGGQNGQGTTGKACR